MAGPSDVYIAERIVVLEKTQLFFDGQKAQEASFGDKAYKTMVAAANRVDQQLEKLYEQRDSRAGVGKGVFLGRVQDPTL